jgi:hypothetical protein
VNRRATVAGVVLAAVLGAAAIVAWNRVGGGESTRAAEGQPLAARADMAPRRVFFGDTVTAEVEVELDPDRVDPDSVRLRVDFSPWRQVSEPRRVRQDGDTTTLSTTFVLRCLTLPCISPDEDVIDHNFPPAQVTYTARGGLGAEPPESVAAPWPRVEGRARYSSRVAQAASGAGWEADLVSLPELTFSVAPAVLIALLLAAGVLLAVAGALLVRRLLPHRAAQRTSPPPAARPERELTPLERALALLEDPARVNGAGDQRRALELVAAVLTERGERSLGRTARALAWSAPVPGVEETSSVAERTRSALAEELHETPE